MPFLDQGCREVFHTHPERSQSRLADDRQVLLQPKGIVHRGFGAVPDFAVGPSTRGDFACQRFGNFQRSLGVIEEIVVGPEEVRDAIGRGDLAHLVGDSFATLDTILPLVVGGNRTVGTAEFAADREHDGRNATVSADAVCGQSVLAQRRLAAGRFQEAVAERSMGQFVEVAQQALDAGVHQLLGGSIACRGSTVDEA